MKRKSSGAASKTLMLASEYDEAKVVRTRAFSAYKRAKEALRQADINVKHARMKLNDHIAPADAVN